VHEEGEALMTQIGAAMAAGRMQEVVPFSGRSAGAIEEILPADEIVRRFIADAENALKRSLAQFRA
jgi:hypothetical protein